MRSVNPYSDDISNRPLRTTSLSNPARPYSPLPKRASSTKTKPPPVAQNVAGTNGQLQPPNQHSVIRADVVPPAPLRPRDINQHVLSLTPSTRAATKGASNMPPGEKPRQPQLGTAAVAPKGVARTPLTPKIASKGQQVFTPLGRKSHATIVTAETSSRDDLPPPAGPYLAANITPRSGNRQARADSASSTPNGTPNPEKLSESWDNTRGGLAMSPLAIIDSQSSRKSLGELSATSSNESNKFFYASEAKPTVHVQPPTYSRPSSVHQKAAPAFFYASDAPATSKRSPNPQAYPNSPPSLGPTPEGASTKFFYANGTPDVPVRPPLQSNPSSGSIVSVANNARPASTRPGTSTSNSGYGTPQLSRPASPVKGGPATSTQSLRGSAMTPTSPNRNLPYSQPIVPSSAGVNKRRISIDAPPKVVKGHVRAGSVPTMDAFSSGPRFIMPTIVPSEPASPPVTPAPAQPAMTMASILQMADELEDSEDSEDDSNADSDDDDDDSQASGSQAKSVKSKEPVNDLVANARRERKVQDLQITNASLEAINRTLERQLRKQTAELRRYKRLSRAGHIPMDSSASSRVPSVAISEASAGLSDLEEDVDEEDRDSKEAAEEDDNDDDEQEEEEVDSLDNSDTISDDSNSNASLPTEKRRQRDQRRLELDLTKHQELLRDSQKMNQSLKRCLDWTEQLIQEGQRALAYQVKVSHMQFGYGGRVLAPQDFDDDDDTSHQPDDTLTNFDTDLEDDETFTKTTQDRDSGIELSVDNK